MLVAKGYAQKKDIDYNEIFSSIDKHTSTQMLLAIVAQFDLELKQIDIVGPKVHHSSFDDD